MAKRAFRFGVISAGTPSRSAWIALAQRTEELGYSLYVTIVPSPLDQGLAGLLPAYYELPGKDYLLHTARPIKRDRASFGSFPGPIDDWRDVASSTRYIRTRSPQEFREKGTHEYVVRRFGLGGHPS